MPNRKQLRRQRALDRLQTHLADKTTDAKVTARLLYEAQQIKYYLDGGKKFKKRKPAKLFDNE